MNKIFLSVFKESISMIKNTLTLFILLLVSVISYAQTPFIRNFTSEDYKSSGQNWSIAQDHRGIMYFANNNGVLEYDGFSWRIIITETRVRSLCIDSTGLIYVGQENDFGFLQADSTGLLKYTSLKKIIPEQHKEFGELIFYRIWI